MKTVPVGGADTISVTFSEDVTNINVNSLTIEGLAYGTLPQPASVNPFVYDSNTHVATWRFNAPLPADQYHFSISDLVTDIEGINLDGEWINPFYLTTTNAAVSEFPSGDGIAGGDFNFVMTILPGDWNRDNVVDGTDFLIYQQNTGGSNRTFAQGDGDGNGTTNSADLAIWSASFAKQIGHLFFADFNHDGIVNSADQSIWNTNNGWTGQDHDDGDVDLDEDVDAADGTYLSWHLGLELDWVE